jgi:CheY-like chemotaxis protein
VSAGCGIMTHWPAARESHTIALVNKVLVVDDEEDIREAVRFSLEQEGFHVACASNGYEALQQLRVEPEPCLVLLDLMMPVMSGWQFRAAQLIDPLLSRFPVVVMSATSNLEDAAIAADGLLRKPVRRERLLEVVREFCASEASVQSVPQALDGSVWDQPELNDSNPRH